MKLYKKMKRAMAFENCDPHYRPAPPIAYEWYDEDDFPTDMKERVKKDNPFGGWYTYSEFETFVEVKNEDKE